MVENTRKARHSACAVETKFPSTKVSCSNHLRKEKLKPDVYMSFATMMHIWYWVLLIS
jgi:hypothetical protein